MRRRLSALAILLAGTLATPRAASAAGLGFADLRLNYPQVLNHGPAAQSYHGVYGMSARFGAGGDRFGMGLDLRGYWLSYDITGRSWSDYGQDENARSLALVPFAFSHFGSRSRGGFHEVVLALGAGPVSRKIRGVDGELLAFMLSADVTWMIFPWPDSSEYFGPTLQLVAMSDGVGSNIGPLYMICVGLTVGLEMTR